METFRTNTITAWVDDRDIVHLVGDAGATQELVDAQENVRLGGRLVGMARRPVLVDMRAVKYIERDARAYYSSDAGSMNAAAIGIVVDSQITRMLANLVLAMARPGTPRRLFTDINVALDWLTRYVRVAASG